MRLQRAFFGFVLFLIPAAASAQFDPTGGSVAGPGVSLVFPDDALAVEANPAALSYLPDWAMAFVHSNGLDAADFPNRGEAFYGVTPLPLGLGVGFSLGRIRPSGASLGSDRGFGAVGFSYAESPYLSYGFSVRYLDAISGAIDGRTPVDMSVLLRPNSYFAMTVLIRELNGPFGWSGSGQPEPLTVALGAALRPDGTANATLELNTAITSDGVLGARVRAEFAPMGLGRIFVSAAVDDVLADEPALDLRFGLTVDWDSFSFGSGIVLSRDPFEEAPGAYGILQYRGQGRSGIPRRAAITSLEVDGAVGPRRLLRVILALDHALNDSSVSGLYLRLRGTGIGMAAAQEIRQMISALEAAGKRVLCHLDSGSGSELYACTSASATTIDPAGGVRLMGPQMRSLLLGDLIEEMGLRTDFIRIGQYKSAVEQFTNRRSSAPARAQRTEFMDDIFGRMVADFADGHEVSTTRARAMIDNGPYVTTEAVDAGVITGSMDEWDAQAGLDQVFGADHLMREGLRQHHYRRWGAGPRIGVIVIDDTMVDGDNINVPLLGIKASGGREVTNAIESMAADPSIRAIVVRIDSPGGAAMAADQIWRALRRAQQRKPVIASMGAIAASAGYYAAAGAQEIYAPPSTLTGSIGIFFGKVDVLQLAEKLEIGVETMGRGQHAGAESLWRPFTDEERAMLADKIRHWYRIFLSRVAEGRNMTVEEVDAVGRGHIWSGDAALRHGLIDHLGGFGAAVARARELANLGADAPVVVLPWRPTNLLETVVGQPIGLSAHAGVEDVEVPEASIDGLALTPDVRRALSMMALMASSDADSPLALMPGIVSVH